MARHNPFAKLMETESSAEERPSLPTFSVRGASKSIINSIDELASRAESLLDGETIVQLDPDLVDPSFVKDRLEEESIEFEELKQAISERGQDTPILVRPHPSAAGRYMVVFGHRRLKAAKALGLQVRAIVRSLTDEDHVLAQGQENSARANLSFIERAFFANELAKLAYDKDNSIVLKALSIDKSTLSKMLAVASIPSQILEAVGPAKGVGRDRWYELKIILERPEQLRSALEFVAGPVISIPESDDRFNALWQHLKDRSVVKRAAPSRRTSRWEADDKRVVVNASSDGKSYQLGLKSKDAVAFGEFISGRLKELYSEYRNQTEKGD